MQQSAIFGPVFAMILLTFAVWIFLFVKRIAFIQGLGGSVDLSVPGELARVSPAEVSNPSDNLKNLFEMPVLFYVLAGYLFATGKVDAGYVTAAWIFFVFRALHSAVHCSINIVMLRFNLYLVSVLALAFIALRAAFAHFSS